MGEYETLGKNAKHPYPVLSRTRWIPKAKVLIETVLKPKHIQPPPHDKRVNYVIDIATKWLGSKCYFIAIYHSLSPHAASPTFETKFARMVYVGHWQLHFNLAFMRHTNWSVSSRFTTPVRGQCLTRLRTIIGSSRKVTRPQFDQLL